MRAQILSAFSQFDYDSTLQLIETTKTIPGLPVQEQLFLFEYQSYTLFNLGLVDSARAVFNTLLAIDPDYQLDTHVASPKICRIFEEIRSNIQLKSAQQNVLAQYPESNLQPAYLRTLVLPGWGHLYRGQKLKGQVILSGYLLSLGASIYFCVRTNSTRDDYMADHNPGTVLEKYDVYNKYYRARTAALVSTGTIWLLSQFDLVLWPPAATEKSSVRVVPSLQKEQWQIHVMLNF